MGVTGVKDDFAISLFLLCFAKEGHVGLERHEVEKITSNFSFLGELLL